METFLDGGLFELAFALAFALVLNFIFVRKYLLVLFSLLVIGCPVALFFIRHGEMYYWLVAFSLVSSVLLTILLWKEKLRDPHASLFKVDKIKEQISVIRGRLGSVLPNGIMRGGHKAAGRK